MARFEPTPRQRLRGAVQLAGTGFDRVAEQIHQFHRAISDLPFERLAPVPVVAAGSQTTRVIHDAITDGVYAGARLAGGALFGAAALALRAVEAIAATPPETRPSAALDGINSAVNGLVGDFLAAERNPLAVRLGFYAHGQRLPLTRAALAAAQPKPTGRLAIFVHGLCCNEDSWRLYAEPGDPETEPYPQRLHVDLGFTPFFARYNTGLHVSQNGRLLARALARLVDAHPEPVREIALIGHSMGGLVSRAACHSALRSAAGWTEKVSNVICLGAPHLGAPLERAVHFGTAVMDAFRLTAPLAAVLNARSRGIQDLRYGYTADEDWRGRDPQRQYDARRAPIARLPGARYHFIGSSIGRSERDPMGELIGDGLVQLPSSTARDLADADTAVLFRTHHLRLLNHPVVYQQIRSRLTEPVPSRR
jgi:alpha-beta hydrolase superfamily lysophospholipase